MRIASGLNPAQRSALLTSLANVPEPDRRLDNRTADENGRVQGPPGSPLGILNTTRRPPHTRACARERSIVAGVLGAPRLWQA